MTAGIQIVSGLTETAKAKDEAQISLDEAVAEGKQLVKAIKSNQMRLGELADRLQTKYGEQTLARFAKEIGVNATTVERWRSTYRKRKGKPATEPVSPSVLKALQGLPQPVQDKILKEKPNLTVRQAHTHARDYRAAHPAQAPQPEQPQSPPPPQPPAQAPQQQEPPLVIECRRWITKSMMLARMVVESRCGHVTQQYLDLAILRPALTTPGPEQVEATLRAGGEELIMLADKLKGALAPPPALPPPDWTDEADKPPSEPASD